MKQWSMFIGRWQQQQGHRWLIDQRLKEGKNVWSVYEMLNQTKINLGLQTKFYKM